MKISVFLKEWNEHIQTLNRLAWNLNPEQIKKLERLKFELRELIEIAGINQSLKGNKEVLK